MAKPDKFPRWATGGSASVLEPTEPEKDTGWAFKQKPPHNFMNWLQLKCYQWLDFLYTDMASSVINDAGGLKIDVVDTNQIVDLAVSAGKLQADSVTKEKINADVAGAGIAQAVDGALELNVDGNTIQVITDVARVGDNSIDTLQLANGAVTNSILGDLSISAGKIQTDAVTNAKIQDDAVSQAKILDGAIISTKLNADVAGAGLTLNGGTNAIQINFDDSTVEVIGDVLRVKDDGITGAKLAPAVAGNGLVQDGSGNLDVNVDDVTIGIASDALEVKGPVGRWVAGGEVILTGGTLSLDTTDVLGPGGGMKLGAASATEFGLTRTGTGVVEVVPPTGTSTSDYVFILHSNSAPVTSFPTIRRITGDKAEIRLYNTTPTLIDGVCHLDILLVA